MHTNFLSELKATGFIAIIRRVYGENLLSLTEALYAGGTRVIEITYDQEDPDQIKKTRTSIAELKKRFPDMLVGAGTVLNEAQVYATKEAGGSFIVSPNTNPKIIQVTKKLDMASFPGAMTPSEIVTAYNFGADVVKLFPAAFLGTKYIKELKGPIGHIPLMATGGVTVQNFTEFLQAGCLCAGIGSFLSDKGLILLHDWKTFEQRASELIRLNQSVIV